MLNGDVNEFLDHVHCGDELVFTFAGQKFFLQGFKEEGRYVLYLARWEPPADGYAWVGVGDANEYPVKEFLKAKIWNGRDFWEAQDEMEWVDG